MDAILQYLNNESSVSGLDLNLALNRLNENDTIYDLTEECFDKLQVIFDMFAAPNPHMSDLLILLEWLNKMPTWNERIERKQQKLLIHLLGQLTQMQQITALKIIYRSDFNYTTVELLLDKIQNEPVSRLSRIYGKIIFDLTDDQKIVLDLIIMKWFDDVNNLNCDTTVRTAYYYCTELSNTDHDQDMFWKCAYLKRSIINGFYVMYPDLLRAYVPHAMWMKTFSTQVRLNYLRYQHPLVRNIEVEVERTNFLDSCSQIMFLPTNMLRYSSYNFKFKNEPSQGLGVNHEFFTEFCKNVTSDGYGLFKSLGTDSLIPNDSSWMIHDNYLYFYEMIGRVIGIATVHGHTLDLPVSSVFFKYMTGELIDIEDMCAIDPVIYSSYKWLLDNDITGLDQCFTVSQDVFGENVEHDLVHNGSTIQVTNDNKASFVSSALTFLLETGISLQVESIRKGFRDVVISYDALQAQELKDILCAHTLNVEDWQTHSKTQGFKVGDTDDHVSERVRWFWEIVSEFDEEERTELLQFATGLRRVPHGTFKKLDPIFTVADGAGDDNTFPTSNTCIHQIVVPPYSSKNAMKDKMTFILSQNTSFGYL